MIFYYHLFYIIITMIIIITRNNYNFQQIQFWWLKYKCNNILYSDVTSKYYKLLLSIDLMSVASLFINCRSIINYMKYR